MEQPKEAFYAHLKYFVVYRDIKGKHSTKFLISLKKVSLLKRAWHSALSKYPLIYWIFVFEKLILGWEINQNVMFMCVELLGKC